MQVNVCRFQLTSLYIEGYYSRNVTYLDLWGTMKSMRLVITLPTSLKVKLDAERKRGTSAAGLIRHLLEQHFKGKKAA